MRLSLPNRLVSAAVLLGLVLVAPRALADFGRLPGDLSSDNSTRALRTTVGRAVHVNVPTSLLLWQPHLSSFHWSFGDPTGSYNTLNGFNAAHVYQAPGIYPVRLNGQVFAQAVVAAAATPQTVHDEAELRAVLTAGGSAQLPPGTIKLSRTIDAAAGATLTGSPGGTSRLYWSGAARQPMLTGWQGGLTVRDVTFASAFRRNFDSDAPDAIRLGGANHTVVGCRFADITTAVNGNGRPDGVLVQDCLVSGDTDLRGYLVWGEGRRWTILGNSVPNSTRETPVRLSAVGSAPNCQFVLVAGNALANIERTQQDPSDVAKGALRCESVDFCWVEGNDFAGITDAGPLGGADGLPQAGRRVNYVVWRNNVHRGPIRLKHGLQHFLLENSRIDYLAGSIGGNVIALGVEAVDPQFGRYCSDLTIRGNVLTTPRRGERQVWVMGQVTQKFEFANNLLVQSQGMLMASPARPSIAVDGGWQAEYSSRFNTFPAAGGLGWPNPLAVAQVGSQNDPSSYLEIPQWLSLPGVTGDQFANVPVP